MRIIKQAVPTGDWVEMLGFCDKILCDRNLYWAYDRIFWIRKWIQENEFVTDKQKNNILNVHSCKYRLPMRNNHWDDEIEDIYYSEIHIFAGERT